MDDFTCNAKEREVPFYIRECGLKPSSKVLDYGCGLGRITYPLSEYLIEGEYLGVDVVKDGIVFLRHAYRDFPHFSFEHLNLRLSHYQLDDVAPQGEINDSGDEVRQVVIPALDQYFDFQISTSVFTHMQREDIEATLREIKRKMKPGSLCYNTWLIVDETAKIALREGKADRELPYEQDGMFFYDSSNVLMCTAYSIGVMQEIYRKGGHDIMAIHSGSWKDCDNGAIYQDIVISRV